MKLITNNLYSFEDSCQNNRQVPAIYCGYLVNENKSKMHFFQVWNVLKESTWKHDEVDSWRSASLSDDQLQQKISEWGSHIMSKKTQNNFSHCCATLSTPQEVE